VFVAVDADGGSVAVPKWAPVTEGEKRYEQYAIHMAAARKEEEAELLAMEAPPAH
jgi:acyl-CoA hydrolase